MTFLGKKYYIWFVLILLGMSASCIPLRRVKYVQKDKNIQQEAERCKRKVNSYKIQQGDNIYVKFSSLEPVSNDVLSQGAGIGNSQGMGAKYRNVYLVDTAGYVSIPQLRKLKAEGLSLSQLKDTVERKIQRFYHQVTAEVRLADNYITILGEVNSPGRYLIDFKERLNVFELLGTAGDLSFEANRNEVKLIRNVEDSTEIVVLDLTKRNIIENEYYYLMPNDIVYVEPLRAMKWHSRSFPFSTTLALVLSTTSAVLVIFSYFN